MGAAKGYVARQETFATGHSPCKRTVLRDQMQVGAAFEAVRTALPGKQNGALGAVLFSHFPMNRYTAFSFVVI